MIYKLMELAGAELKKRSKCTDDWQWNERCFQFVIITNRKVSDPYRFCYDPNDVLERTAEEQLMDWIDRWFF